jgi:hypothetical protein
MGNTEIISNHGRISNNGRMVWKSDHPADNFKRHSQLVILATWATWATTVACLEIGFFVISLPTTNKKTI